MIDPRALTDNEQLCPDCGGEKFVAEVRPCTSSTAIEPFMATGRMIPCPNRECDGKGTVLKEERRAKRRPHGPAWTEQQRVSMECTLRGETIARLERENRALRIVVRDQARLLDRAEPMRPLPAVAAPPRDELRAAGEGRFTEGGRHENS